MDYKGFGDKNRIEISREMKCWIFLRLDTAIRPTFFFFLFELWGYLHERLKFIFLSTLKKMLKLFVNRYELLFNYISVEIKLDEI